MIILSSAKALIQSFFFAALLFLLSSAADAARASTISCFEMSLPAVGDLVGEGGNGDAAFTIDQQQRLQGYMPVIVMHLYNANAGLLPGANIPSGPGFVDKSNYKSVASQAGVNR